MDKGIDTAVPVGHIAEHIKNEGYSFVCRYYSTINNTKNLGPEEAEELSKEGLYICSVWENGYPTSIGYFSEERGIDDLRGILECAEKSKQPKGTVIYVAVDFDCRTAELVQIMDYLRPIENGLYKANFHIGVYGSGLVIQDARSRGIAKYGWLAMAKGWGGYYQCLYPNIRQLSSIDIQGISCDTNESNGNGGGWKVPV